MIRICVHLKYFSDSERVSGMARLSLVTGLLGGLTTVSAFSLKTGVLWERAPWLAVVYVAASVLGGLAAFGVCYWGLRRGSGGDLMIVGG